MNQSRKRKNYAKRACAICDKRIRRSERLCTACKGIWKEDIESGKPWVAALIEAANQDFNYQERHSGRTVPLEWVEGQI